MKCFLAVGSLVVVAGFMGAQERIEPAIAQKYARLFVECSAKQPDLQLKIDGDAERPYGMKDDQIGAMVIPDKKLSEEVLKKAGKAVTPLAQLWLRNLTMVVKDQPVPNNKLRIVTINDPNGQDHPLPLFLLGVRKKTGDSLELVVYGPGKEPLAVSPLRKVNGSKDSQELPIELEGKKGDNDRGTLTLNILGKYQAELTLAKQE